MKGKGFSLLEILVVLIIVGILFAVAIPISSRMISDARIRGATNQLAQNMREARERAVSRGHQVILVFDTLGTSRRLSLTTVYVQAVWDTVLRETYDNSNLGLRPTNPPNSRPPDGLPAGAPAGGIDFTGNQAVFSPQGGCTPGAIYFHSRDGKFQTAVSVNLNGRVRTWRWDNGAWY